MLALRRQISTLSAQNAELARQVSIHGRRGFADRGLSDVAANDDDEDLSDYAALTHEMLQTKQLLQRVLLENDELYRQQREAVSCVLTGFSSAMN